MDETNSLTGREFETGGTGENRFEGIVRELPSFQQLGVVCDVFH